MRMTEDGDNKSVKSKQSGGRSVSRQSRKSRASSSKRSGTYGRGGADEQSFEEEDEEIGENGVDFEQDALEASPQEASDGEDEPEPLLWNEAPPRGMSPDEKDPRKYGGLPSRWTRRIIPAGKITHKSEGVGALMGGE